MATAEITVIPIGREGAGISGILAEVARQLAAQDRVRFKMHAMGTDLEGAVPDILKLAGELQEIPLMLGVPRVYTVLKIDNRVDREQTLEEKVASVEEKLLGADDLSSSTPPE